MSGMVDGFVAGGFYRTWFGTHAGHGVGDLGYLFYGAAIGAPLGLAVGQVGIAAFTVRQRLVLGGLAAFTALVTAVSTWLWNLYGAGRAR